LDLKDGCGIYKMFLLLIVVILLVAPILVGFFLDIHVPFDEINYTLTIFAISSTLHFILQLILATLNTNRINKHTTLLHRDTTYAVQVSGWKEDPDIFEKCLLSIKDQFYPPSYIFFCSDGNEEDDEYMVTIFRDVFPTVYVLRLDKRLESCTAEEIADLRIQISGEEHVCITQPHHGKRHAMYTQMQLLSYKSIDALLLMDSDTVLHRDSVHELVVQYQQIDNVDAITGDVCIYNKENFLTYLVSLKYWYAFNIERASQSYIGNVSCISGPMGFYRRQIIAKIMRPWIAQTFLKKECTFGDDRHLTNLILKENGKTYYNQRAICVTDTPNTWKRFISQQTRWAKSFVREYLLNFKWFHKNQLWIIYDLSFMAWYSFLLTLYIVWLLCQLNYTKNITFFLTILVASFVRTLYGIWFTRDINHIVFTLYAYVYVLIIIPIKIWAMLSIHITHWGTGSRLIKSSKYIDSINVVVWNIFVWTTFILSVVLSKTWDTYTAVLTYVALGFTIIPALLYTIRVRPTLSS
jgi:hyaluronan synthase